MKSLSDMLQAHDWHYDTHLEYDTEYSCDSSGCSDEGICRCSEISNARVDGLCVDKSRLAKFLRGAGISCSDLNLYGLDRLLRGISRDSWEVNVGGGYYGDEIDSVTLLSTHEVLALDDMFSRFLELPTDADKVKFLLTAEYKYLLPQLVDRTNVSIVRIAPHLLHFPEQHNGCARHDQLVQQYSYYDLPVAVVSQVGTQYKVIDGNHRATAAKQSKRKKIQVIVLS
jgi:hypothetical protein